MNFYFMKYRFKLFNDWFFFERSIKLMFFEKIRKVEMIIFNIIFCFVIKKEFLSRG